MAFFHFLSRALGQLLDIYSKITPTFVKKTLAYFDELVYKEANLKGHFLLNDIGPKVGGLF